MEEKCADIISDMLFLISQDIRHLLDEDFDSLEDAIENLAENVETLSDDIYENKIVYNSSCAGNVTYNMK